MSNCNSCQIILTEDNRHLKMNKCRPCQRIKLDQRNILASQKRLEASGLSKTEIQLTLVKWDKWYASYLNVENQNQIKYNIPGNPDPYEHITSVLMKRHIMMELISIFKIDYCYPNKRGTTNQLPPSSGVYYEERMKNTRPWTARNG